MTSGQQLIAYINRGIKEYANSGESVWLRAYHSPSEFANIKGHLRHSMETKMMELMNIKIAK